MNAEEQMKAKRRMDLLETLKEIRLKTTYAYCSNRTMEQLFDTKELTDEEIARLTEIQNDIDWILESYRTRVPQQIPRRDER